MINELVIFAVNLLVLAPALNCGLVVDDTWMVNKAKDFKKGLKDEKKTFSNVLSYIKFMVQGAGVANNTMQDHAIQVLY